MEQQLSLWQRCLVQLQDKIDSTEFSTWLRPLQGDLSGNNLTLYASNQFVKGWVEQNYLDEITRTAQFISKNTDLVVNLVEGTRPVVEKTQLTVANNVTGTFSTSISNQAPPQKKESEVSFSSHLNTYHSFDNFVEGKSNQFARAVGMKVAQKPGDKSANPLYLYGGSGLGKTHLLQAVGNAIVEQNPQAKVLYVTSERFVQEYSRSVEADRNTGKSGNMEKFKKHYRSLDALLIDDIQFLSRAKGTQEELFNTFNSLFDDGKQIILTCDRYPREIDNIDDRLQSRFSWGLSVAIEPPELQTRVAILMKKAEERNVHLPEEVALFIGQKLRTNVRELEGALNRVQANAEFMGKAITVDFVRETLKDMLALQEKLVTVENIQKTVADYYHIKVADLTSKSRSRSVTRPRQLAMALAKELTSRSLPEIGKGFGGRDHTTVMHACKAVIKLREEDSKIQEDWTNLIRTLSA